MEVIIRCGVCFTGRCGSAQVTRGGGWGDPQRSHPVTFIGRGLFNPRKRTVPCLDMKIQPAFCRPLSFTSPPKPILANLIFLLALACLAMPMLGRDLYWSGAGNDGLWSNRTNWHLYPSSPPGYAIPSNGDNLELYVTTTYNDLTDLQIGHLTVYEGTVNGNALTVTQGILATNNASVTVTFNCPLIFPNSQTVVAFSDPGTLTENTLYLHFNGPITITSGTLTVLAEGTTFQADSNSRIYFSGQISGNGDLFADMYGMDFAGDAPPDDCSFEFNGVDDNTFTGTLFLSTVGKSQIFFNKSTGHVVNSRISIPANDVANLKLNQPEQIGGNTEVELQYGTTLFLSGNNMTVGSILMMNSSGETNSTTLDTGTVLVGINSGVTAVCNENNVTPTIKGRLNLNGFLPFYIGGTAGTGLDIQAAIQGNGFKKTGPAALVLNGANTFTGDIEVNDGILDVRKADALGTTTGGILLTGNGSMTLHNLTISGERLTARGTHVVNFDTSGSLLFTIGNCTWSGPIQLDTNLVVWADNTFLNGPISGPGGINLVNGTATIGGSDANTFTGTTLARCDLFQFNKPSGTKAYAGPLVVGGGLGGPYEVRWLNAYQNIGATLSLYANGIVNLNNHNEDFGPVTFNGGEVDTGTGQFTIYQPLSVNANSATAIINGYLGLPSGDARHFVINDGPAEPDLLVNAVMIGSPTYFVKEGAGTMRLANANTFFATTLLENGILDLANNAALGTGGCVIFNGASLRLAVNGSIANNFEATGAGPGGTSGAIQIGGNNSATLTGSLQLDANTFVYLGPTASLALSGVINGAGALTKSGVGALTLSGGSANTYAGDTTVASGLLYLAKSGGAISVPGNLVLGPAPGSAAAVALLLTANSIGGSMVTVNANSALNLNGRSQTLVQLNLNDGGSVATGSGTLNLNGGATVSVGSLSLFGSRAGSSITGNIGLPPNAFTVNFNVSPYGPSFPFVNGPELDVPATIFITAFENPNIAPTHIAKNGLGTMRLTGNNGFKGGTYANAGTLQVDGSQPGSGVVASGGTLKGTGSVGPVVLASASSVIAPGDSPGILTCSNFNNGGGKGTLKVELNGTTAGTGYSQLNVHGTVNLTGVNLSASLGYLSSVGDQFTILANDGVDAIVGTFNGLPPDAQFYIGGQLFQISYGGIGKLGNDVTLTRLATPPLPLLTIQNISPATVRLLWATNDPPFSLQSNTNAVPTDWSSVLPTPAVIGTNNVVTNAIDGTQRFYRLIHVTAFGVSP
jgi:autotransporter-associated beta strand protein